jgi:hypothetical protein
VSHDFLQPPRRHGVQALERGWAIDRVDVHARRLNRAERTQSLAHRTIRRVVPTALSVVHDRRLHDYSRQIPQRVTMAPIGVPRPLTEACVSSRLVEPQVTFVEQAARAPHARPRGGRGIGQYRDGEVRCLAIAYLHQLLDDPFERGMQRRLGWPATVMRPSVSLSLAAVSNRADSAVASDRSTATAAPAGRARVQPYGIKVCNMNCAYCLRSSAAASALRYADVPASEPRVLRYGQRI